MNIKKYTLMEPGGRVVRGFENGRLTEVRYIDVVPAGIESSDLDDFLLQLRQASEDWDPAAFSECRVGHIDKNGAGRYYDPLEFLERRGQMESPPKPRPIAE